MLSTSHGQDTAIGVKAHVLYSQLLTAEEYWSLLSLNSTGELADFLKQTAGYKEYLETLPPTKVHRVDLENAVRSAVLSEATSFLAYLAGPRRQVFTDWLGWYESEQLKSIFRWIRSRRIDRDTMRQRLYSIPGSKLSYDLLLNSRDYAEALEALRNTRYYKAVQEPVRRLINGEESLFSLELAIDNLVETQLYCDLKKIPDMEQKLLEPLFGSRIDLLNLYHFHRCTLYYHMTLEETLSRMLPVKYKIKTHDLRNMAKSATWEEGLKQLDISYPAYAKIFLDSLGKPDEELALEMSIKRYNYFKALSIFQKGSPGFHTAMSYFVLKSHEVDDVIHIIEDVRYDYDRRNAVAYLIRPIIGGGEPTWQ
ncbi:MAG: V-type ATPase subunit [Synergistaceae bacterium]|nr:V-type ATPase subunit [Synergistaceae bacterium]